MSTTNPLLVSIDPAAIPIVQVDPLQRPGAREVNGVVFDPLIASSVTRQAEAQAAQTADFVAQQRAAMQQTREQANQLVEQVAQRTGINPLTGQPVATAAATEEAVAAPTVEQLAEIAGGNRGLGAVSDLGLALGSGLGQIFSLIGDGGALLGFTDSDNAVSSFGRNMSEEFRKRQTPEMQARRALVDQEIAKAETVGGEFAAALAGYLGSPSLLLDAVFETLPSMVGSFGAGTLAKFGVRGATRAAGRSASAEAAERLATRGGMAGFLAANTVQQAVSVGGETLQELMDVDMELYKSMPEFQQLKTSDPNMTDQEAKETIALTHARDATLGAAGYSAAAQALPGARNLERILMRSYVPGAPGRNFFSRVGQNGAARFARGTVAEGVSEGIEEGGGAYSGGLARQAVDPTVNPLEGVGGQVGVGAAVGGLLGGTARVVGGRVMLGVLP